MKNKDQNWFQTFKKVLMKFKVKWIFRQLKIYNKMQKIISFFLKKFFYIFILYICENNNNRLRE